MATDPRPRATLGGVDRVTSDSAIGTVERLALREATVRTVECSQDEGRVQFDVTLSHGDEGEDGVRE